MQIPGPVFFAKVAAVLFALGALLAFAYTRAASPRFSANYQLSYPLIYLDRP